MGVLTPNIVISLLYVFWIPAQIGHFIGFFIANKDDIYINKATFYLGDIISWGIMALASWLLVRQNVEEWGIWVYFACHAIIISTILSDLFMHQETMDFSNIGGFIKENIKESIIIPWISGIVLGGICILIFGV